MIFFKSISIFVLDTTERCKSLQFLLSDHNSESTRKKLALQAAEFNLSICYECCQTRKKRKQFSLIFLVFGAAQSSRSWQSCEVTLKQSSCLLFCALKTSIFLPLPDHQCFVGKLSVSTYSSTKLGGETWRELDSLTPHQTLLDFCFSTFPPPFLAYREKNPHLHTLSPKVE